MGPKNKLREFYFFSDFDFIIFKLKNSSSRSRKSESGASKVHEAIFFKLLKVQIWTFQRQKISPKFGHSIISKNCLRHFWRSGLRFSRSTRRVLQFEYKTSESKKSNSRKLFFGPKYKLYIVIYTTTLPLSLLRLKMEL